MRDAANAGRLVGRARFVPQHVHHNGGALVFQHDGLKTIVEGKRGDILRSQGRKGEGQRGKNTQKQAAHGHPFVDVTCT